MYVVMDVLFFLFRVWVFIAYIIYIVLLIQFLLHSRFREEASCYTTLLLSGFSTFGICNVKNI